MKKTIHQEHRAPVTRRTLAGVALGLLWLVSAPGLAGAQYKFTTIDVPGSAATYANGNTMHRVVGEFDDANGDTHGFVLRRGQFTQFDAPGADGYTSINGVNLRGQRAGIYFKGDRYYGYFFDDGVVTTIDPPDAIFSAALFVNAQGQVGGYYVDSATRVRHGFVWRKGELVTAIDAPEAGPGGTRVEGLNDRGDVVGFYTAPDHHLHGYVYSQGTYTTLDVPGSEDGYTFAQGVNNYRQIVGIYAGADEVDHGFVLTPKGYTTVDVPNSLWTDIYSIDANGNIVGAFEDATGVHGFRGTPSGRLVPDAPADAPDDDPVD